MPTDGDRPATPTRPVLVGRTEELARLQDSADLAVESGAQVVLLNGEAGIGKSSLATAFIAQLAEVGWGGHIGHCIEYADRSLPFGPVVAILRSVLLDNLDDVDRLVGHHRLDLSGLLPELRDGESGGASLAGDVDRLFDAISATLIQAARRRPVAVLVEDIHWADAATRDLLASLVHSLGTARILLLVTERAGAVARGHPLRTWLAEQQRFPNVHRMELRGFSRGELSQQAEAILGHLPDAEVVDDLFERTGGNAYFAHELLTARRDGSAALPTSLVAFLTSRLERLDDDERDVLRAIAIAGGVISHPMLTAMLPGVEVGAIVRSLFDASILLVEGSNYTFGHALLREAILGDVLPFEAEDLHRRAAMAIAADPHRRESLSDLAGLALHWGEANDPDRSLVAATAAADAAAAVAAYDTAAELTLQALAAWPRASDPEERTGLARDQMLLNAAEWLTSCYRGEEAVAMVRDALDGWGRELPDGRRALLLARISFVLYHLGRPTDAMGALAEAEHLVGDEVSAEAAQVHHRVSKQAIADGQIRPALEAAERAIAIASTVGPHVVLAEALATKALATGVTGDLEGGVAFAQESRELARRLGLVSQLGNTYRTEMLIYLFIDGRTDKCLDASRQGLAYAEQHCGPRWRAEFQLDLCLGYVEAGRLKEAEPFFETLMASKLDDLRRLTVLQTTALYGLAEGSLELAALFLADATEIAERYQSAQETGYQFRLSAELARRQGRLDEARDHIDKALKLQLEGDNLTYTRESIVEKLRLVRAASVAGSDDAPELLQEVAALVASFDGVGTANLAMRSLMDLELAAIEGTLNPTEVSAAIDLLAACGMRYEEAQVRLLFVEQLHAGGAEARAELEAELHALMELTLELGTVWIGERARAVAAEAGIGLEIVEPHAAEAPSVKAAAFPHDLTAREVEVMSLLAEGLTNKGIGELLYVSPRTVGTHVSNLLAKLHLRNRGEAAAAYHRLGLADTIDLRDLTAATTAD